MRYPSGAGLPRATSSPETTVSNAPLSPTASRMASITGRADADTSPRRRPASRKRRGISGTPGSPRPSARISADQALALPAHQVVR